MPRNKRAGPQSFAPRPLVFPSGGIISIFIEDSMLILTRKVEITQQLTPKKVGGFALSKKPLSTTIRTAGI
jgi:hypothetical protein